MAEAQAQKTADPLAGLPSAKDLLEQIARKEAEKASAAMREMSAAEAEKKALIDKFTKPSGVSDDDRMARAVAIIKRAANNGLTEVEIGRFPNQLCTDRGRAINQREAGWEKTLTGLPKELYDFWEKHLKDRGYKIAFQIVDFPGAGSEPILARSAVTSLLKRGRRLASRDFRSSSRQGSNPHPCLHAIRERHHGRSEDGPVLNRTRLRCRTALRHSCPRSRRHCADWTPCRRGRPSQ